MEESAIMTAFPAFCATCHMTEHDGRACDADALKRRRRLAGLGVARDRLRAMGYREMRRANFMRSARLFGAAAKTALRMSALLAEEADAIMGRRSNS